MTALEINELRLANKRLNQQLVRAEKTRGTSLDLTKTPQYKRMSEIASQQGVKSKGAPPRFKERGLEKLTPAEFERLKKQTEKASMYKSPKAGLKEQLRRFEKAGIKITIEELSDFNEIQKSSLWKELEEYYNSDEIIEIMQVVDWKTDTVSEYLDYYNAWKVSQGETFDPDEFREIIYTRRKPWEEAKKKKEKGRGRKAKKAAKKKMK